jgi:NTE family protein
MEIGLALGSGGVKGNAHIGVLRVLEKHGFEIKAMAGTSAGGLIGAVYLSGYSPDEIQEILENVDQDELFKRNDEDQPSLLGLEGMQRLLIELIGFRTFDDLPIPFAVTAVDLNIGKPVVIRSGKVVDAVLATIAIPGVFPAKECNEQLLVDGAIYNPVPVNVVRSLDPKLPIAAVPLSSMPDEEEILPETELFDEMPVLRRITRFRFAQALTVFLRSQDISGRLLTELRLQVDKPDVIIRPDLFGVGTLDKVDVAEIVKLGEEAAESEMKNLLKAVRWDTKVKKLIGLK